MARNGKRVLAIVLSMALLITTLTSALIGLVGSADSASGSGAGAKAEGIINIPLYDANYTYKGPAQQGSGDTELVIASAAYWETLITLNKAYDLHAAQYADIQVSATEHYNDGDKLNITFSNGATYAVDTADLKVGELNTVRLQMDAALDWYAVNSITLSVTGEGAALAEDAQYGFAALNFYTKRISLGDVADSNLDGTVDVVSNVSKTNISEYWVSATADDVGTFFHCHALSNDGQVRIAQDLSNYFGEAGTNNVYGGISAYNHITNNANALKTVAGKGAYVWNGNLRYPIVGEYWATGKDLSGERVSVELYIEKEMTGTEYGEVWVEFSSYNQALHSWHNGAIGSNDNQIGFFIAVRYLHQGWNTVYLDPSVPGGRGGTPLAGTTNVYGVFCGTGNNVNGLKGSNDWDGDGADDLYTDAGGRTNDGWWMYARGADATFLNSGASDLYHNRVFDKTSVHNFRVTTNGMAVSTVGKLAVGQVGIVGNDNTGYILTGDATEYNTFFWSGDGTVDVRTGYTVQKWCDDHGYTIADHVMPAGSGLLGGGNNAGTNNANTLKSAIPYGDGTRGYYLLKAGGSSQTQGLDKYFGTPISLSGSNINAWIYVDPNEELVSTKTVKIRFSSYPKALHDQNVFDQAYAAYAQIPSTDLKAGWNLVTINPNATAKVGNVYGVTKGASYDSSRIYNLVVNRPGTVWTKQTGIGAIYEVDKAAKSTITAASGNLNKTFNASNSTYMAVDITLPAGSMLSAQDFVTVSLGAKDKGNEGANDLRWNVPISQLTAGATTTVKLSLLSPEEVYPMRGYTTADLNNGTVIPYDISWLAAIDSIAVSVTRIGVIAANDALVTIGNIAFLDDYIETTIDASSKSKAKNPAINSIATVDSANAQFGSAYVESSAKNEVAFFAKDYNHTFDRTAGETQYMPTIMSLKEGDVISFWVKAASETKGFNLLMEFASGAIGTDIGSRNNKDLAVGSGSSPVKNDAGSTIDWSNWDGLKQPDGTINAARYATGSVTVTTEWKEFRFTVGTTGTTSLGGSIDWRNVNFMRFFNNGTAANYMVDGLRIIKADSIQADTSKVLKLRQGADVNTYDASRNMVITATREDGTTYVAANNAANVKYDLSQVNTAELGTYPVIVSYNNGLADLTTKVYVEVVADKQYLIEAIPGETMSAGTYNASMGIYGDGTGGAYNNGSGQKGHGAVEKLFDVPQNLSGKTHLLFWVYLNNAADINKLGVVVSSAEGRPTAFANVTEYRMQKGGFAAQAGWNLLAVDLTAPVNEDCRVGGYGTQVDLSSVRSVAVYSDGGTAFKLGSAWADTAVGIEGDTSAFPGVDKGTCLRNISWASFTADLVFSDGTKVHCPTNRYTFDCASLGEHTPNAGWFPVTFKADVNAALTDTQYVEVRDTGKVYLFNGWNIGGSGQVTKKTVSDSNGVSYYANQVNPIDASADQGTKEQWIVFGGFTATDLTSADTLHILMYANEGTATGYYLELSSAGSPNNNKITWNFTSLVQKTGVWHEIVLDLHTGKAYSSSAGGWTTPVDGTIGTAVIPDFSAMNYMRLRALNNTTDQPAVARIWIENDSMDSYDLIDGESYENVKHNTQKTLFGQFNGKNAYKWNSATDLVSVETDELYTFYWARNLKNFVVASSLASGVFQGGTDNTGVVFKPELNGTNGPTSIHTIEGRNSYYPNTMDSGDPVIGKRFLTAKNLSGKKLLVNVYLFAEDADGEIWIQLNDLGYSVTDANAAMRNFRIPTSQLQIGWNTVTLDPNVPANQAATGEIGYNTENVNFTNSTGTTMSWGLRNKADFDLTKVSTIITRQTKMNAGYGIGKIQETTPTNGTYFKKYLAPISMETTELLETEFYVEDLDAFTSAEIVLTSSKAAGTGTRTFTITKDMLSNDGWNTVYINYADGVDAGKFDPKMVQVVEVKSTVTAVMDLAIAKLTMYTDNARTTEWTKVENGHQATFTKGEGTITPVLPHEWTEWTTEHTNHGDEKHRECKVCGYIEKAAVEDGEGANGPTVTDEWDRLQETDNSLVFKGSWTSVQYGIFTDGRAFRTSSPSATVSFTFNGTALQINSYSSPTQGSFDVVITDASGNVVKNATYSMKEDEYRIDRPETKTMVGWCSAIIVDLETEGEYTALITANGDGFLWIDAVDVLGEIVAPTETLKRVTVQENEFHGNASTDWQDLHLYQFSGEHALRTKVGGATLSLTFTGTQSVDLISYLSTSHGAVIVTLTDSTGTAVDTQYVDLTMGATGVDSNYQRSIFTKSGLDEAENYTITVTNAIDGKWCLVDAVILYGTNPNV